MSCERYDDPLNDYVDGARASDTPQDRRLAAFEAHLSACARCQTVVADFTSIRRTAGALEEHVPSPRLWARIASSLDEDRHRLTFATWMPGGIL